MAGATAFTVYCYRFDLCAIFTHVLATTIAATIIITVARMFVSIEFANWLYASALATLFGSHENLLLGLIG